MSDELDRAVDARMEAFRPKSGPPFSAIEARARRRDRRRRAAAGVAAGVALVGGAVLVVPSPSADQDRVSEQPAARPPAASAAPSLVRPSPLDDSPALVVHIKEQGAAARVADTAVRACLQQPGVGSRPVDAGEPPAYVVTADADADADADAEVEARLAEVGSCLGAVRGVLVERSTEGLAGRGPVPVATMNGGGPVYEDDAQQVLAERLRDRLRGVLTDVLPGELEDHSASYATTRTPDGPSRNLGGAVTWHDDRGYVLLLVQQVERAAGTELDACVSRPAPELDCARVTPRGGGEPVTVFTAGVRQGGRAAVVVLEDGSGLSVTQLPQDRVSSDTGVGGSPLEPVTPRPELPLSDRELAAVVTGLAE